MKESQNLADCLSQENMNIIKDIKQKDRLIQELQQDINDQQTQNQLLKNENRKKSEAMAKDDSYIQNLQKKIQKFERQIQI